MTAFPDRPEDVTDRWLSHVLGNDIAIESWEPIGSGQVGDSARFYLRSLLSDAPTTIAAKFPSRDQASRTTAAMMGLYSKEVRFYREVARQLAARVPRVYHSELSDDGVGFVLLFEDLGPARGGDQIRGCNIADARAAIRQAAAIHAPSWDNAALRAKEWLRPNPGLAATTASMYPKAQALFRERYADQLEPEYMQLCEDLAAAADLLFGSNEPPQCLIHSDFRLDNMLFEIRDGAEAMAVLDWQTVTLGKGMTDIGYFLGCGIGNALRSAHEEELLDLYLEEMDERGVPLTRQDIWRDYRLGALHGIATAVFSAAYVERTQRGDANFLSMARGACALAASHDSIGALKGES